MRLNKSAPLDEIVGLLAQLGVPGLILTLSMASTGFAGAAAITSALACLGPGGMLGGIGTLIASGFIADALAKYGAEKIISKVIKRLYKNGETPDSIEAKINDYWISKKLKLKLIDDFRKLQSAETDR